MYTERWKEKKNGESLLVPNYIMDLGPTMLLCHSHWISPCSLLVHTYCTPSCMYLCTDRGPIINTHTHTVSRVCMYTWRDGGVVHTFCTAILYGSMWRNGACEYTRVLHILRLLPSIMRSHETLGWEWGWKHIPFYTVHSVFPFSLCSGLAANCTIRSLVPL